MSVSKGVIAKRNIEDAAARLFSNQGFHQVTMREIAREAGCSHTLIYMYYKDKEDLLCQLAIPLMKRLEILLRSILNNPALSHNDRLKDISKEVISFCLFQRCMVSVLFENSLSLYSNQQEEAECKTMRNRIHTRLREAVIRCLPYTRPENSTTLYRLYMFALHGMILNLLDMPGTPVEQLHRAGRLIEQSIDILLGEPPPYIPTHTSPKTLLT